MRFDTVFARNIIWIVNLQRILRMKMRRELTEYNKTVINSHPTTALSITELYANERHADKHFEKGDDDISEGTGRYTYNH